MSEQFQHALSNQPTLGRLRRWDETGVPVVLARLLLGGLFIYMGAQKAIAPIEFLKGIRLYQMLPEQPPYWLNLTAVTLPWIEILCGVLLVLGVALRGTALMLLGMLTFFTVAVFLRAWEIHTETAQAFCAIHFDCGCGTGVEWICGKLVKNTLLWLLSLIVLVSRSRAISLRGELTRPKLR